MMDVAAHGISGGISGLVAILVWYPLDNLRMKLQIVDLHKNDNDMKETHNIQTEIKDPHSIHESVNEASKIYGGNKGCKNENTTLNSKTCLDNENLVKQSINDQTNELKLKEGMFSKITDYLKNKFQTFNFLINLIRDGKFTSLYDGMKSAMVGTIISYGIYFFSYKLYKDFLAKHNFDKGVIINSMITSFLAACSTCLGTNPVWVLNTRMASSKKAEENTSNWEMIKIIYRDEGIGGFFKGLIPSLMLTANPVIQFIIYEYLREKLIDQRGKISGFNVIILSILSKLVTTFVTYPMLTVKTLFQANEDLPNSQIFRILKDLLKNEGILGYFKGIGAKIPQTLINNVILMLTYEKIQHIVKLFLKLLIFGKKSQPK
jgi:adenine nucleotide transporter 17